MKLILITSKTPIKWWFFPKGAINLAWFRLCHIFNKMCQSNSVTGLGTGAVMVAEDDSGYYGAQEFSDGQARSGAQVTTAPASIWTRQTPSAPKPSKQSDTRRVAIEGISDPLEAGPVLI